MSNDIKTIWCEDALSGIPLPEYPRPQMERDDWVNLNGWWDFAVRSDKTRVTSQTFSADGRILVPYAIESSLSGVGRALLPGEQIIYRRSFNIPSEWKDSRILLNFEAVDYECRCFINGTVVGTHRGGYLPFSFDITEALGSDNDENELMLVVTDPSDTGMQQRGKQVLEPGEIYYTATSGIWQTVWLESIPMDNHITDVSVIPDINKGCAYFTVETSRDAEVKIQVSRGERTLAEASGRSGRSITVVVVNPALWEPGSPVLYETCISLVNDNGSGDSVRGYFGFRSIEINESGGIKRICLNGKPVFLSAPLDQGYWPESGMTPPSDAALVFDIEKTLELGFNCTRKHIKIEPRRWYYHADRLGLMVMQDMVSGGRNAVSDFRRNFIVGLDGFHSSDSDTTAYKKAGRTDPANRLEYEAEMEGTIRHLFNHPAIIMWVIFNEAWGQFDSIRIAEKAGKLDSTRLIDPVSGWHDQGGGDFRSRHIYKVRLKVPPAKDKRVYFISEYGGYNLLVDGHLWDERKKFGYKTEASFEALMSSYSGLIRRQLLPLIRKGLGAAVYTQFSDVEIESNGFYTYDRKVLKMDPESVRTLNGEIYREFEAFTKEN